MAKFYVTEISDGDSKIKGKSIYEYENLNDAEAAFHSKLGTAMKSELYAEELIYVTDSDVNFYFNLSKHYVRPIEEVAQAVTEE